MIKTSIASALKSIALPLASIVLIGGFPASAVDTAPSRPPVKKSIRPAASGRAKRVAAPAPAKPAAPAAVLLDGFESAAEWTASGHDGTSISVGSAEGRRGKALKLAYDLKDTQQWVHVSKALSIQGLMGKSLELWVKGQGASNFLEVKLVDADGSTFGVKKESFTALPQWTRVVLNGDDFAYWWGGDKNLDAVKEVFFAVSAGAGGSGELFLDDLGLASVAAVGASAGGVIASGEDPVETWSTGQGDGSNCTLAAEKGPRGKVLALSYTIPANQWVSMRKKETLSLSSDDVITVSIKGEGAPNNVEFKLIDGDDSTFGRVFEGLAGNNAWQELRIPVSQLQYMWGGDNQLDRNRIRFVEIAVSGPGGSGKMMLGGIKVVR